ncbi:heavy-metal-associated domain-containing protein [Frankia sp. CNm7]|uniref:Copper chaperone CopZ n=1 Tax=Frankia nepalensis TaxID=1836974 RepID=A0A937UL90_9ACTN|nr:heavy metal-associated domain-containing protein [Frankia nepalensis]MBL7502467.1 heavy-metal-associated domain-containing protein [Frankia nepalensis]MBL7516361.1 heavy-metal-associated domain-containing protein [Frankia nepalensis]MBL7519788.1 heavy-metal-associated domain-containing protein [Frankia nepalensis]MBL7625783.1 heavy-metal-associated domain-containing protein [Frankia nepalensis]
MSATTHTFRVEGMHCASCALLIDDALEDLPGVRGTQTTLKQGRTTVDLDLSRNSPQDVVKVIEELGYQASPLP